MSGTNPRIAPYDKEYATREREVKLNGACFLGWILLLATLLVGAVFLVNTQTGTHLGMPINSMEASVRFWTITIAQRRQLVGCTEAVMRPVHDTHGLEFNATLALSWAWREVDVCCENIHHLSSCESVHFLSGSLALSMVSTPLGDWVVVTGHRRRNETTQPFALGCSVTATSLHTYHFTNTNDIS